MPTLPIEQSIDAPSSLAAKIKKTGRSALAGIKHYFACLKGNKQCNPEEIKLAQSTTALALTSASIMSFLLLVNKLLDRKNAYAIKAYEYESKITAIEKNLELDTSKPLSEADRKELAELRKKLGKLKTMHSNLENTLAAIYLYTLIPYNFYWI